MSAKLYAIDRRVRGEYANHNGHGEGFDYWKQVCTLEASRAGKALQRAGAKLPGELRARLVRAGLEGV